MQAHSEHQTFLHVLSKLEVNGKSISIEDLISRIDPEYRGNVASFISEFLPDDRILKFETSLYVKRYKLNQPPIVWIYVTTTNKPLTWREMRP